MKLKRISFMRLESRFGPGESLRTDQDHGSPKLADMLRYDVAFQSTVSPEYIAFPVFQTKHGNLGGNINHARWHSFGVYVKYISDEAGEVLSKASQTKPDAWITYRHPRDAEGRYDYHKLVPVSLETFCSAKDTDSIDEGAPT